MPKTLYVFKPSTEKTDFDSNDRAVGRKYILLGYLLMFLFFGSVGLWTVYAPVSSAAVATGIVSKDGHRKTIQHLEGGIIHKILVNEGDLVTKGQALVILDDVQYRSKYQLLRNNKILAEAKEATLVAELNNKTEVVYSNKILSEDMDASVLSAIEGYLISLTARQNIYGQQLRIVDERIDQSKLKIAALHNELKSLKYKGSIINDELSEYRKLKLKGLVTRAQMFSLKRDKASNLTDRTTNQVSVESTKQDINELRMEKINLYSKHSKLILGELDSVRQELVILNEQLTSTSDRFERTVIKAPIAGIIVDLKINTVGGVIGPGDAILDIVPDSGELVIEAKIDPKDRDTVRVGQLAEVRFLAFNQRTTRPVKGKVVLISADSLITPGADRTTQSYYKAKVELLENPEEVMNGVKVFSGMQADVMIITGERTVMEYFLKPIIKSFNRAFRDD